MSLKKKKAITFIKTGEFTSFVFLLLEAHIGNIAQGYPLLFAKDKTLSNKSRKGIILQFNKALDASVVCVENKKAFKKFINNSIDDLIKEKGAQK